MTGQRYVLDANAGIFEILEDGTAVLVRSNQAFPIPDVAPISAWTDFVALGDDQFAVTARSDGYLLDLDDEEACEYAKIRLAAHWLAVKEVLAGAPLRVGRRVATGQGTPALCVQASC